VTGQVAHDDSRFGTFTQAAHGLEQKSRFARTRGGQNVEHQQATATEEPAIALRQSVVFVQDRPPDLEGAPLTEKRGRAIRGRLGVNMRVKMAVGVGVRVVVIFTMVEPWTVLVLMEMLMSLVMFVFVFVVVFFSVVAVGAMQMRVRLVTHRLVTWLPATALFT